MANKHMKGRSTSLTRGMQKPLHTQEEAVTEQGKQPVRPRVEEEPRLR